MDRRAELRVSNRDRHAAAERLLAALNEGRLDLLEYDTRLAKAYAAVTYADLDDLFVDLPAPSPGPVPVAERAVPAAPPVTAALPLPLRILWTIWATGTLVNLAVWLLLSFFAGDMLYFWPVWLLIPGVALVGVTFGTSGTSGAAAGGRRRAARSRLRAERRAARRRYR